MTATPKVAPATPQMVSSPLADSFADVVLDPGVSSRMRDGATLVADVYRPKGDGPWPVLLMRTAYGRDVASSLVYAHPAWFSRHGFIVVVQDVTEAVQDYLQVDVLEPGRPAVVAGLLEHPQSPLGFEPGADQARQ